MDKIAFARLICFLASCSGSDFNAAQIAEIDRMISDSMTPAPSPRDVVTLVESIASDRKIEAIKAFRTLTGWGLKESKDAIETVTNRMRSIESLGRPL